MKKSINEMMDELVADLREFCVDMLIEICGAERTADGIAWKSFNFDVDEKAMTDEELSEFSKNERDYISWLNKKSDELYDEIHKNAFSRETDFDYLAFNEEFFELKLKYQDWEFTVNMLNQNFK